MTNPSPGTRRLRAKIIGFGLDGSEPPCRVLNGDLCLLLGGSDETHAEMLETILRLEAELERLGQHLGELPPEKLAEIAWRIDSPELHEIALSLDLGLRRKGRTFHESTADELTDLAAQTVI
jgi:hypothetical protein